MILGSRQVAKLMVVIAGAVCPNASAKAPAPTSRVVAIQATGVGHPAKGMAGARAKLMARRAAEVAAARNLALKIDPTGRQGAPPFRYVSTKFLSDGSVEVVVEAKVVESMLPKRKP